MKPSRDDMTFQHFFDGLEDFELAITAAHQTLIRCGTIIRPEFADLANNLNP